MKFANVYFDSRNTIRFNFQSNDKNLRYASVSLDKYPTLRDAHPNDRNNFRINQSSSVVYWPSLGFDLDAEIVAEACVE